METRQERTIGQLVAEDYRTAQVFKNHKIDFCCKGNRSIKEVAEKHYLNSDELSRELVAVQQTDETESIDFQSCSLDILAFYIEKIHHRYVEEKIPVLKQYLNKLCKVHGERHPELHEIAQHYNLTAGKLTMHMKKEELMLFPWIRKMVKALQQGEALDRPHFGSVKNPIAAMMQEHENEGERFMLIATLSNEYTPPEDACNTFRVAFSLLQEFENDLHRHIHLENNILFPKAEELERTLQGSIHNIQS